MEVKWPTWHIDNAVGILEDSKYRLAEIAKTSDDEQQVNIITAQLTALDLGISVIRSIPEHTPPALPSLKLLFRNVVGGIVNDLGRVLENAGIKLQDANSWGWQKDPYD